MRVGGPEGSVGVRSTNPADDMVSPGEKREIEGGGKGVPTKSVQPRREGGR